MIKLTSGSLIRPADVTAYAVGDVVAAVTTSLTLPFLISRYASEGGIIRSAVMISSAQVATHLDAELFLFSSNITDIDADNATFTPTDAQMETLVGVISFATASWKAGDLTAGAGGNSACVAASVNIASSHDTLYGVVVARNAYIPVSSEKITVRLYVEY